MQISTLPDYLNSIQRQPKLLGTYLNTFGRVHGLAISDDGNRAYFTSIGAGNPDPAVAPANGLIIADVSDIQSRKANPQVRVLGTNALACYRLP